MAVAAVGLEVAKAVISVEDERAALGVLSAEAQETWVVMALPEAWTEPPCPC